VRIKGLFLAATLVFISCSFSQARTPKIEFSERIWDFGRVPQNSTVSHIFWIKNIGTDTLKGISVKTP
jgi:hypothetical protein